MNVRMNTCRPFQGQESCPSVCHDDKWPGCRQSPSFVHMALDDDDNNNDNNNNSLQLGCHPVAVVILHVHKI